MARAKVLTGRQSNNRRVGRARTNARPISQTAKLLAERHGGHVVSPLIRRQLEHFNSEESNPFRGYAESPVEFAESILNVELWEKQIEIAEACVAKPHTKVLCPSSHLVGKTYLLSCMVLWRFYSRLGQMSKGIITAPTKALVTDAAMATARVLREKAGLPNYWVGQVSPRMEYHKECYFDAVVPTDSTSFQGRHAEHMMVAVDEAVGIEDPLMWEAIDSLLEGETSTLLAMFNPTKTGVPVHSMMLQPDVTVIKISCLDHPNVKLHLDPNNAGKPVPFPGAITLRRVRELISKWSTPVELADFDPARHIKIPNEQYQETAWLITPQVASRLLGIFPVTEFTNIWTESLVNHCRELDLGMPEFAQVEGSIGVDPARFGSDFSAIAGRMGSKLMWLQEFNGLDTIEVAGRAILVAREMSDLLELPARSIPIYCDGNGPGAGVVDQLYARDYNVIGINASERAFDPDMYPGRGDEIWFGGADEAKKGNIDLSYISTDDYNELRRQFLAINYTVDGRGRKKVEPKRIIRKRLGRSPDMAEAVNMAYCDESGAITVSKGD